MSYRDLVVMMGERGILVAHTTILVDFYLSRKRDVSAAKAFLRKAMKGPRIPTKNTLDAYVASHRAVADFEAEWRLAQASPSAEQ